MRQLFLAGWACLSLAAQETPPPTSFQTTVNVVVAPTTVMDRDGKFMAGLQPQDFRLYDNGKLQDVKVDVAFVPISLVVAVQASSGVEALLPKIQRIGPLLQGLLIGEQGEAAIVVFDHRIQVMQDFTNDGTKLSQALRKITPGSWSSRMVDAVNESIRMLRNRPANRRRILLLISETRDKGSQARVRETMTEAQIHNVLAYTVNINRVMSTLTAQTPAPRPNAIPATARPMPPGAATTPTTVAQAGGAGMYGNYIPMFVEIFKQVKAIFVDNPAEVLTKFTGGREFAFSTTRGLEQAIAKIGEELHSQYIISYTPNNKLEGGWHEIQVVVNTPGVQANVRTRPGYWIAAVPE